MQTITVPIVRRDPGSNPGSNMDICLLLESLSFRLFVSCLSALRQTVGLQFPFKLKRLVVSVFFTNNIEQQMLIMDLGLLNTKMDLKKFTITQIKRKLFFLEIGEVHVSF